MGGRLEGEGERGLEAGSLARTQTGVRERKEGHCCVQAVLVGSCGLWALASGPLISWLCVLAECVCVCVLLLRELCWRLAPGAQLMLRAGLR